MDGQEPSRNRLKVPSALLKTGMENFGWSTADNGCG